LSALIVVSYVFETVDNADLISFLVGLSQAISIAVFLAINAVIYQF